MAHVQNKRRAIILCIVLVLITGIAVCAVALAFSMQRIATDKTDNRFTVDTSKVTGDILKNIMEYDEILHNAHTLVGDGTTISQNSWKAYFDSKNTLSNYKNISYISYAEVIPHSSKQSFIDKIRAEGNFGSDFTIYPAGDRDSYLVARLIASNNNDVNSAYGFDGFSTAERRDTYFAAEKKNRSEASPPFMFATGHLGFFVAMPVIDQSGRQAKGFVIIGFRATDFLDSLYKIAPDALATKITDVTDIDHPIDLFESHNWSTTSDELTRADTILFAGRTWKIYFASSRAYQDSLVNFVAPRSVLIIAGVLILSIALSYFIIERRHAAKGAKSRS